MATGTDTVITCTAGYYSQPLDFYCKPCPKGHKC